MRGPRLRMCAQDDLGLKSAHGAIRSTSSKSQTRYLTGKGCRIHIWIGTKQARTHTCDLIALHRCEAWYAGLRRTLSQKGQ